MGGRLIRTVIGLDDEQKTWLDQQAALRRASMASLVRRAVNEFREREQLGSTEAFRDLLKMTAGIWQAGDGLEYQERMRNEWP